MGLAAVKGLVVAVDGGGGGAFIAKMTAITANIIMAGDEWRLIVIPNGWVNQTGGGRSAKCFSFHGAQRAMLCCLVGRAWMWLELVLPCCILFRGMLYVFLEDRVVERRFKYYNCKRNLS